jgi:serine/threonine-protein kinase RsbW
MTRVGRAAIEARSDVAELERIAAFIDSWCDANDVSSTIRHHLQLVAEELAMNSIMYGYADREDGVLVLTLSRSGDHLSLVYQDEAPPFDPLAAPPPDVNAPLEDRQIGGLGIHLIKTLTHSIGYRRDGGKNVLTAVFQS